MNTNQTSTTTTASNDKRTEVVSQLASFCRGEMSAAETYGKAIANEGLEAHREVLLRCQQSHAERARLLSSEISRLGGQVPTSSGIWGTLVNTLEGAATLLGAKTAIDLLEEGEDHGLRDYRADISKLDESTQALIRERVLPQQIETHHTMSMLKTSLAR